MIMRKYVFSFLLLGCALACGNEPVSGPDSGDVEFFNNEVRLSGTLTLPDSPGPHPAMVTVHGSGRQTREAHRSIAEFMVERGVAVLRYDKRGVGRSGGAYSTVGTQNSETMFELLSGDALAAIELLRAHPDIDSSRIGLLGISQAGWIIPLAAAKSSNVAFTILASGPTVTVGQEIFYSDLTGDDAGSSSGLSIAEASEQTRDFPGPHGFDPVPSLEAYEIPGLWIFGAQDRSIPVPLSVEILDRLARESDKDFMHITYPNADHGLRDVATGVRLAWMDEAFAWLQENVIAQPPQ